MKVVILFCSVILLSMSNAYAKDSSAAKKLFKSMDMKYTMSQTVDKIVDQQILANPSLKEKQTDYRRLMHDILKWENLEPQYIVLYSKYFTDKELNQIIEFNNTPTGKKLTNISPDLTAESMKIAEELIKKNADKFTKLFAPAE